MSDGGASLISQEQLAVLTALLDLCAHIPLSAAAGQGLPRAVLRSFASHAHLSRAEAQPSPYHDTLSNEDVWQLHSLESRGGHVSIGDAWGALMREGTLSALTPNTKWVALTIFARFLAAVARAGRVLDEEYAVILGTVQRYQRRGAGTAQSALPQAPSHYDVATGKPLEPPSAESAKKEAAAVGVAGHGSYSVFTCLRECIMIASSTIELDLHREPSLVSRRKPEEVLCTRFLTQVLGFGSRAVTPRDVIDNFFYCAVPRTCLGDFTLIADVQREASKLEREWLTNANFALLPAAPIAGIIVVRAVRAVLTAAGDSATAAALAAAEDRCVAALHAGRQIHQPNQQPVPAHHFASAAASADDDDVRDAPADDPAALSSVCAPVAA